MHASLTATLLTDSNSSGQAHTGSSQGRLELHARAAVAAGNACQARSLLLSQALCDHACISCFSAATSHCVQVVKQALAAAKEELSPMLGPLLPLLQAVHAQHAFPCCLDVVGAALDFCGQIESCRAGLAGAVGAFVRTTLQRIQVCCL